MKRCGVLARLLRLRPERIHWLAFFVYGLAKSSPANLPRDELATYRLFAGEYLALDLSGLAAAQAVGAIVEVNCDDKAVQK